MSIIVEVSDVEAGTQKYEPILLTDALDKAGIKAVKQAQQAPLNRIMTGINPLIAAAHVAFDDHLPLSISPDDVWLSLVNAFAIHVNQNAEALRNRFVRHAGKKTIEIRRDSFVRDAAENSWFGCLPEFAEKLGQYIGETRWLIESDFSTTDWISRTASQIGLMDSMQNYFDCRVATMCGIPRITFKGGYTDWLLLAERIETLASFDAGDGWWSQHMREGAHYEVRKIADAFNGSVDTKHFQDFVKVHSGSGGDKITGGINAFFPYLFVRALPEYKSEFYHRPARPACYVRNTHWTTHADSFPIGLTKAPFVWDFYGEKIPMAFRGGHVGVNQAADGTLSPVIGLAVTEGE